jgi:phosphotransferase system enzyme I (PtsI)
MYRGIGTSSGIAIGQAFVLPTWEWDFQEKDIDVSDMAKEFDRLYDGIRNSKFELNHMKKEIADLLGYEESNIFDAHLAILEDPVFMKEVHSLMQMQYKAAEVAVKEVIDKFSDMFTLLDDDYMKERALDIRDVGHRLIKHLLGMEQDLVLPSSDQPYIIVAKEITPSQLAHLEPSQILGMVTMIGGTTSHTAIMARAMGIPMVSGLEDKLPKTLQSGDSVVIDGDEGVVYVKPEQALVDRYLHRKAYQFEQWQKLQEIVKHPTVSKDGFALQLSANISSVKELDKVIKLGASGVGLFRTEFLYMDRSNLPEEDEQFEVYKQVAERLDSRPLVIRTLDIGGDKQLDYLPLPEEDNPSLGYCGIRISIDRPDLFKTQLKAILRASAFGQVKILYPMISSLQEVRKANIILEECKQELNEQHIKYNPNIQVGIMIEIPAAAAISDLLAQEVDFFSIGTNDLVQYVLAVDRMSEHIAYLYEPYHPAVLRMLQQTVDAANTAGIPVSVCGEMAGDPMALPIWMALGVKDLSMSVQSILRVKKIVLDSRADKSKQSLQALRACKTSEELTEMLKQILVSMQQ